MRVTSAIIGVVAFLAITAARADAVSLRDIVELSRAGLGDEVLVALIEVDQTRYDLDAERLLELQAAGVSETVMLALLRSGREAVRPTPTAPEPAPLGPQVIVIEERPKPRPVFPTIVGVPFVMPAPRHAGRQPTSRQPAIVLPDRATGLGIGAFFGAPLSVVAPTPQKEPVYWGWGGQRRPDTWDPPATGTDHSRR